jgi:membrane protein insertase Oxa1/YidC/SpoIIIJ
MKCSSCRNELSSIEFYCKKCGELTDLIPEKLSAKLCIDQTKKSLKSKNISFYLGVLLLGFLPLAISIFILFGNYWMLNLAVLILGPVFLLPLSMDQKRLAEENLGFGDFLKLFKQYHNWFGLILVSEIFYLINKVVCTGKPFFDYVHDPILYPVEVVLGFYWLAIVLPAPYLISVKKMNPIKAVHVAYQKGKDTRWQQFFLFMIVGSLFTVASIPAGIGLLFVLPFVYHNILNYGKMMDDAKILD